MALCKPFFHLGECKSAKGTAFEGVSDAPKRTRIIPAGGVALPRNVRQHDLHYVARGGNAASPREDTTEMVRLWKLIQEDIRKNQGEDEVLKSK